MRDPHPSYRRRVPSPGQTPSVRLDFRLQGRPGHVECIQARLFRRLRNAIGLLRREHAPGERLRIPARLDLLAVDPDRLPGRDGDKGKVLARRHIDLEPVSGIGERGFPSLSIQVINARRWDFQVTREDLSEPRMGAHITLAVVAQPQSPSSALLQLGQHRPLIFRRRARGATIDSPQVELIGAELGRFSNWLPFRDVGRDAQIGVCQIRL